MAQKQKQICDIYLTSPVSGDHVSLKGVNLFTACEFIDVQKTYNGYLGVNLSRLHAVAVVTSLRQNHIAAFSTPIEYRDYENIPREKAIAIAADFLKDSFENVVDKPVSDFYWPVFWAFPIIRPVSNLDVEERAGTKHIYIDKIDGRIWSYQEVLEYNYDYNNLL